MIIICSLYIAYFILISFKVTHALFYYLLYSDPEDFFSAVRYNVTFNQTAFTDRNDPAPTAMSSNVIISIVDDDYFEGVEYFQARIVQTSDEFRVRKGPQNTVEVIIVDNDICT